MLSRAFERAMDARGAEARGAVQAATSPGGGRRERYEACWRQVISSYAANRRLWLATAEAAVQAEHSPRLGG